MLECSRSSGVMPPSPVVVLVPTALAPRPSASLAGADSAPKLIPAIVIGIFRWSGLLGVAVAEHHVGVAALAVALERVARHAGAEEQQVVEVRHARAWRRSRGCRRCPRARRAGSRGSTLRSNSRGLAQPRVPAWRCSASVLPRVVDVEVVEPPRRAVAAELARARSRRRPPARAAPRSSATCSSRISFSTQSAPSPATVAAHVQARLVDRVAERVAGVAAHHEAALLGHERAHVPHRARARRCPRPSSRSRSGPTASPPITSSPPRPLAPADWLALPSTTTRAGHHVLGHPDAGSCRARARSACLFMPAQ